MDSVAIESDRFRLLLLLSFSFFGRVPNMADLRFSLEERVLPVVEPATGAAGTGIVSFEALMIESRVVCTGALIGFDLADC